MVPRVLERTLPEKLAQLQALVSERQGCACACEKCVVRSEQNGACDCWDCLESDRADREGGEGASDESSSE